MKMVVQIFGKGSKEFPDLLRSIADQIDNGEVSGSSLEENYCYDYILEDESYHRKFMIYSNDFVTNPKEEKENKILGIAFGSCPHKAFEGFNIKGNNIKNVVVREVIGNPVYKILTEEEIG
jgi:hypothetical protein